MYISGIEEPVYGIRSRMRVNGFVNKGCYNASNSVFGLRDFKAHFSVREKNNMKIREVQIKEVRVSSPSENP